MALVPIFDKALFTPIELSEAGIQGNTTEATLASGISAYEVVCQSNRRPSTVMS